MKYPEISIQESVARGRTNARHGLMPIIAKPLHPDIPHVNPKRTISNNKLDNERLCQVANEVISGHIGRLLSLPIPNCGLATSKDGLSFYSSLIPGVESTKTRHLTIDGLPPRASNWKSAIEQNLEEAWGITLYDIWICNADRVPGNIRYDPARRGFIIFDHGSALIKPYALKNPARWLAQSEDVIPSKSFRSNTPRLQDRNVLANPFFRFISRLDAALEWYDKINTIPYWQISQAVATSREIGIPAEVSDAITSFLAGRRRKLWRLIAKHQALFSELSNSDKGLITDLALREHECFSS